MSRKTCSKGMFTRLQWKKECNSSHGVEDEHRETPLQSGGSLPAGAVHGHQNLGAMAFRASMVSPMTGSKKDLKDEIRLGPHERFAPRQLFPIQHRVDDSCVADPRSPQPLPSSEQTRPGLRDGVFFQPSISFHHCVGHSFSNAVVRSTHR